MSDNISSQLFDILNKLDEKMSEMRAMSIGLQHTLNDIQPRLVNLEDNVITIKTKLTEQQNKLQTIETKVIGINATLDEVKKLPQNPGPRNGLNDDDIFAESYFIRHWVGFLLDRLIEAGVTPFIRGPASTDSYHVRQYAPILGIPLTCPECEYNHVRYSMRDEERPLDLSTNSRNDHGQAQGRN